MLNIQDLNLLKITKVRTWSILFDYDDKHYLLHGKYEMGECERQELYERTLNEFGKYDLIHLKTIYGSEYVEREYIRSKCGSGKWVYNQIDKEFFVFKLSIKGFAVGILDDKASKIKSEIEKTKSQICKYQTKIIELEIKLDKLEG